MRDWRRSLRAIRGSPVQSVGTPGRIVPSGRWMAPRSPSRPLASAARQTGWARTRIRSSALSSARVSMSWGTQPISSLSVPGNLARAGEADVGDDQLIAGHPDPDSLPDELVGHRVAGRATADRRLVVDDPSHAEGDRDGSSGSGWSRRRSSAKSSTGGRRVSRCSRSLTSSQNRPADDGLPCEHLFDTEPAVARPEGLRRRCHR
jgi:hypothetical protein